MALFDGKAKPKSGGGRPSGGNVQREKFNAAVDGHESGKDRTSPHVASEENGGEEGKTTITHHSDGSHTVEHHDGEVNEHVHGGHMLMALHSKHMSGEGMHVHQHSGEGAPEGAGPEHSISTHHVGMDGMVEGPHHHAGPDEAAEHMKSVMGGGMDPTEPMAPVEGGMHGMSSGGMNTY